MSPEENKLVRLILGLDQYFKESTREIFKEELSKINTAVVQKKISYTKAEFAKAIRKSETFVDRERRRGNIKKWKVNGNSIEIHYSELEKYIYVD